MCTDILEVACNTCNEKEKDGFENIYFVKAVKAKGCIIVIWGCTIMVSVV